MNSTCAHDGCERETSFGLQNLCHYHDAIRQARELPPSELDELRREMATVTSVTDEERSARLLKYSLWSVGYHGKAVRAAEHLARERGATETQIEDAHREEWADQ